MNRPTYLFGFICVHLRSFRAKPHFVFRVSMTTVAISSGTCAKPKCPGHPKRENVTSSIPADVKRTNRMHLLKLLQMLPGTMARVRRRGSLEAPDRSKQTIPPRAMPI